MSESERLLILDANLSHRLASVDLFRKRRRMAVSAKQLGLDEREDPVLLRYIHMHWPLAVLVTADDQMPRQHAALFERWNPTVAIIDPLTPWTYQGNDSWHWEIVHRWCHRMQAQEQGTVYRYNSSGGRMWVRPRRIPRSVSEREISAPTLEELDLLLAEVDGEPPAIEPHPRLFEEE